MAERRPASYHVGRGTTTSDPCAVPTSALLLLSLRVTVTLALCADDASNQLDGSWSREQ